MHRLLCILLMCTIASAAAAQTNVPEQVKQATKLLEVGKLNEAIPLLKSAAAAAPDSYEAHFELGRALDVSGEYRAAREHLERAIALSNEEQRNAALAAMAISFAFEAKANEAARYYERVIDRAMQANDRGAAAAAANALGRIYLESGDLAKAEQWYRTGYETSKRIPELPASQLALWELRWHHALARIAARRGDRVAATKHVAEVKRLLDQPGNDNQRQFYPYLTGYVALYTKQYKEALTELQQGDPEDPFVLALQAQAYDKLGDRAKAREQYERVMAITDHSINNAFARPLARKYLKK